MRVALLLSLISATASVACTQHLVDSAIEGSSSSAHGVVAPLDLSLDGSPSYGPKDAKVTLVTVQGFKCSYCGELVPTLKALYDRYPESVRVVFKHMAPHWRKREIPAAQGAMAAHLQGKFWPYYDRLFATDFPDLSDAALEQHADEIGLDVAQWRIDKESEAVRAKVQHDIASMVGLRVGGTPKTFINGRTISGARPLSEFLAAFDTAIAEANAELERGTPLAMLHTALATKNAGPGFVSSVIEGGPPLPPPPPKSKPKLGPVAPERFNEGVHPDDATMGPDDAPVVLMVFSDFECPFCGKLKPTLASLMEAYPGRLKIVFKHNPLKFHVNAIPASMASLAAHAQGKFWAYHDLLFENNRELEAEDLRSYAEQIGLDMKAFDAFMSAASGEAQIMRDIALSRAFGVTGVPASFVNGKPLVGARPLEHFTTAIDAELEALKP